VEDFFKKNPRYSGLLCLVLGIGIMIYLKFAYDNASSIAENLVLIVPFLLLYGIVITLQPHLFIAKGEFRDAPMFRAPNKTVCARP
jgi:hypothetical protein